MNKKFIITDPCYLVASKGVWNWFCNLIEDADLSEGKAVTIKAEKILSQYLDTPVRVASTGYGDWSNNIHGKNVIRTNFFADAGLVCVVELTPLVDQMHEAIFGYRITDKPVGVAVIEAEGLADVRFDTSNPHWTVITITDTDGNVYRSATYEEHFGIDDEDEEC